MIMPLPIFLIVLMEFFLILSLEEGSSSCAVNLVNEGIKVAGSNLSVSFTGIGPVESYYCRMDSSSFMPCKPITINYYLIFNT